MESIPLGNLCYLENDDLDRLERLANHVARRCDALADIWLWHVDYERGRRAGEIVEPIAVEATEVMREVRGKTLADANQSLWMISGLSMSDELRSWVIEFGIYLSAILRANLENQ